MTIFAYYEGVTAAQPGWVLRTASYAQYIAATLIPDRPSEANPFDLRKGANPTYGSFTGYNNTFLAYASTYEDALSYTSTHDSGHESFFSEEVHAWYAGPVQPGPPADVIGPNISGQYFSSAIHWPAGFTDNLRAWSLYSGHAPFAGDGAYFSLGLDAWTTANDAYTTTWTIRNNGVIDYTMGLNGGSVLSALHDFGQRDAVVTPAAVGVVTDYYYPTGHGFNPDAYPGQQVQFPYAVVGYRDEDNWVAVGGTYNAADIQTGLHCIVRSAQPILPGGVTELEIRDLSHQITMATSGSSGLLQAPTVALVGNYLIIESLDCWFSIRLLDVSNLGTQAGWTVNAINQGVLNSRGDLGFYWGHLPFGSSEPFLRGKADPAIYVPHLLPELTPPVTPALRLTQRDDNLGIVGSARILGTTGHSTTVQGGTSPRIAPLIS